MPRYSKQERQIGCIEHPPIERDNYNCKRCHDWGMLECFDPRHGVGGFWEFCDCAIGKLEEINYEADYNSIEV